MNSRRQHDKIRRLNEDASSSSVPKRNAPVFVGILTVSDRCARGEKNDLSGPNLQRTIQEHDGFRSVVKVYKIVPDEEDLIADTLKHWCDDMQLQLVITTGGTGLGPRDVTPEATARVLDKETPGFTVAIITASLQVTPDAMVTRLKCGIRGTTLIINVPGSKKASEECLNVVLPAIPHAIDCLQNDEDRACSCAHDTWRAESPKRKVATKEQNPVSDEAGREVSMKFNSCSDGGHSLTYKPAAVISLSEDDKQLTDVEIESILSADESTLTFSLSPSENSNRITDQPATINRNTPPKARSTTVSVDEALAVINETVLSLDSEETPMTDAFGKILAEDIRYDAGSNAQNLSRSDHTAKTTLRSAVTSSSNSEAVIRQGTLLTAYQIGVVAGQGMTTCRTYKTPIVGLISIGDKEKVIANHVTTQIHLQQNSVKMINLGIQGYNMGLLPDIFRSAMDKVDIVVAISNTDACREMTASLIQKNFGGVILFSALLARPRCGKSFLVATNHNGRRHLFFILPENPMGSTICSLALIPAYRKMAGYQEISHKRMLAKFPLEKDLQAEPEYVQCKVTSRNDGTVNVDTVVDNENNGRQFQYGINAIAVLPARKDLRNCVQKGDNVEVLLIDVNNSS